MRCSPSTADSQSPALTCPQIAGRAVLITTLVISTLVALAGLFLLIGAASPLSTNPFVSCWRNIGQKLVHRMGAEAVALGVFVLAIGTGGALGSALTYRGLNAKSQSN